MKRKWICLSLAIILLASSTSRAWNHTGHMTVALIAYRRLPERERQAVAQLLQSHPHYHRYLAAEKPLEARADEWAFLRAATWPDYVRGDREHHDSDLQKYHHSDWHYINLPYNWPREPGGGEVRNFPPGSSNILSALEENLRIFGDQTAAAEARAIAACWVLHLIGDLHQPLHCAALISDRFPSPEGDQGGNLIAVRPHKHPERLHSYWDRLLGTSTRYHAIDLSAQRIARAAEQDRELLPQLQAHATVESWAEESLQAAVTFAYLDGRLPLIDYRGIEHGAIPATEAPILPSGYSEAARDVARQRAAMAGYRLVAVLEQALGAPR